MRRTMIGVLAGAVLVMGGCNALFEPFYEAELKRVEAERVEREAALQEVRDEIEADLAKEREKAKKLEETRISIQREYEHAGVDYRFDMQAIDMAITFNEAAAQANIDAYSAKLEAMAEQQARAESDWERRLEAARNNDEWVSMGVGAGLAAIPGVGLAFASAWNSRRKTERATTEWFRDAIAEGRTDPEFDRMVTSDTAIGRSLRSLMRRKPSIAKVVKEGDKHKPVVNSEKVQA